MSKLQGPVGPVGPIGPSGSSSVSYIQPNPTISYTGGSFLSATDLSSSNFITKDAKITTLAVSGDTTFTGNLSVGGTLSSVGSSTLATGINTTNTFGSGTSSINTIGSITTPGTLTLHGATTLDNSFSQTGANTFGTGTGAVSLNGAVTITGANTLATGTGTVTLNNVTTNISSSSPVIDLTTATTLSINTTTNRPVTFGTGTVTVPNLSVTNGQSSAGTFSIDSNATTQTIFSVTGNSITSGTAIAKTITANAGNGQLSKGEILTLTDSTTAGGGFTGIGITVTGAGTGSGAKYLLLLNPNVANNEVVFDNTGAFRPTTSVASNTNTIGSPSYYWKNVYADQVTANSLAGTVITGSTSSTSWTIGSTQAGDVNESIIFQRMSGSGNALLQWNAGAGDVRYLSTNYPLNTTYTVDNTSIGTGINLLSGNLTNNTTTGTQKLLSLTNTGTGTTENGIYIGNTGTGTTALEIAGTWTNGIVTNNNTINAGTGAISGGAGTFSTINGNTITTGTGTLTLGVSKTLTISDSTTLNTNAITLAGGEVITFSATNALSLLTTAGTSVTLPTSGTLYGTATNSITSAQLLSSLSDETGTGASVFANTPTLVTPILGTPTSVTLTNADGTAANLTAGHVTNTTFTTALTVNTGTVSLIGDAANTSALTLGAGASSVSGTFSGTSSGSNTGDNAVNSLYSGLALSKADVGQTFYIGTTQVAINRASAALTLAGLILTTPDLGTPSAVILTNATGLPVSGITASTSAAFGVGTIELGHATDTTITRVSAGVVSIEGNSILTAASTTSSLTSIGTLTGLTVTDLIDFNNTDFNTKLGYQAGKNIVAGAVGNTFVGNQAGLSGSGTSTNTADYNSAFGYQALSSNTSGSYNLALGSFALSSNTTGYFSTAVGVSSLYSNNGNYNVALGYNAGRFITNGSTANSTGFASLFLGYNTKALANGDNNEIVIGYDATGIGTDTVVLGNDSITKTALKGSVGIGQTVPTSKLDVTTAGLGVTQTTSSGLALVNTTAAALGAQQISPALRWSGFGWKTDAVAASQAVDFRSYVVPVQGAANPTGYLSFGSSINGAAYNDGQMVLTSAGNVGINTTAPARKLDILDVNNVAQIRLTQTAATTYSELQTNSAGDLVLSASGGDVRLQEGNLWVCSGGSCANADPAEHGNIIVETSVILNNGFRLKQTGATTVDMYDSSGINIILEFDEAQ
jgi:hypothetical protein